MSALLTQSGMTTHITLILPHHTRCVTGTPFSIKTRVTQSSAGCVRTRFAPRREAFRFVVLLIGGPFDGTLQRLSEVGGERK